MVRELRMAGVRHTLTLSPESTPVLIFESAPGLLTSKIGRRIDELTAGGRPGAGTRLFTRVRALMALGESAQAVEKNAIALEVGWNREGRRPQSDWRLRPEVPGFAELVREIETYANQFNEPDILPYAPDRAGTLPLSPEDLRPRGDRRVLLLGEADFSFAATLASLIGGGQGLVATELRSEEELHGEYPRTARRNIAAARSAHVNVMFEVNAESIPASLGQFQAITFIQPYRPDPNQRNADETNRQLIRAFFASAAPRLEPDGRIFLVLSNTNWVNRLDPEAQARGAGLRLESIRAFDRTQFPGYQHRQTGGDRSAPSTDVAYPTIVLIFVRS